MSVPHVREWNKMKYQSLRFFIQINRILGWIIIVLGSIASLGVAIEERSAGTFVAGVLISAFVGALIFAWGDLVQCFLDIEENTRSAATLLGNRAFTGSPSGGSVSSGSHSDASADTFTYRCLCGTFLRSDVIACPNCGTENPHNPANKSKVVTGQDRSAPQPSSEAIRCIRCGVGLNQDDKFCGSCGYPRS